MGSKTDSPQEIEREVLRSLRDTGIEGFCREDVTFVTQKRVAFTASLDISPPPRTPSASSKRALRTGESAYTPSSVRATAKEEDGWGRQQEEMVNRENASKG